MKKGISSIVLSLIGILFVIWFNYRTSELIHSYLIETHDIADLDVTIFTSLITKKLIAVGIGFISLIKSIKSFKRSFIMSIVGISLSITLFILALLPLWQYFLSDTSLDINFID
ncbi:hypothetical protein [Tenacibaculum sp. M341]|uniref:hypothetical protein n=1 Tax=Tenacibaculum sp. M341 TaxID=2530339 RepID=UPI0010512FD0|nr:hypothetical protein [Tenacibaculum sp. M341]TCI84716.1 hypothetical protein EYW44_19955 [Tenacibaculum sp. M341]